ncbi:hypothetical protein OIO90_004163 [Microbotryomycetes sp. JL221]|nr:hypothetical protein OIO90_004163 [Microbotryomycetes sp. JL221]
MPKARAQAATTTPTSATSASSGPAWPQLTTCTDLKFEQLTSDLIIIENFVQPQQLKQWKQFLPTLNLTAPDAQTKPGHAQRSNFRFQTHDVNFARSLWSNTGLDKFCQQHVPSHVKSKQPVGLNSNIRVYKYPEGSFFGPHYDDDVYDPTTKRRSEWTLLVYLTGQSDGVVGGETAFYPQANNKTDGPRLDVDLVAGRALLHRHGHACMLHEGRKVDSGIKWVLRSDIMYA